MTVRTITLSLSRWHIVAERFRAEGEALASQSAETLSSAHTSTRLSESQLAGLKERGQQALVDLKQAQKLLHAWGVVRSKLAEANAKAGVSSLLAEAEGVRRQIRLLEQVSKIDLLKNKVELEQVNAELESHKESASHFHHGLEIALVDVNALDGFKSEVVRLRAAHQTMMDEVNDKNRLTLSLDLEDEIAKQASL